MMTDARNSCGLTLDEYECKYMEGEQSILHVRSSPPWWCMALTLGIFIVPFWMDLFRIDGVTGSMVLMTSAISLAIGLAALMTFLSKWVTRVIVTKTHLRVHRGLNCHDIALDAITEVSAEHLGYWRRLTFPFSSIFRENVSCVTPGSDCALKVTWRTGDGQIRTFWATFTDAPMVCTYLNSCTGLARVRVQNEHDDFIDDDSERGEHQERESVQHH